MSTSIERWTAALLLAAVLFPGPTVLAQEPLACGETISRELAAGALHRFSFVVAEGESVAVDLFEISNDEGGSVAYRVSDELGVIDEACEDDEVIGFELFDLDAGAYDLEVFLCDPRASARYSLTLAGTSATFAGEDSCGTALSCAEPSRKASFPDLAPGAAERFGGFDTYRIEIDERGPVEITAVGTSGDLALLELRLYDEAGDLVEGNCDGTIRRTLRPGRYALLVNDCLGVASGDYRVVFSAAPCPPNAAADRCEEAIEITDSSFFTVASAADATTAPSDPSPSCRPGDRMHSVWYRLQSRGAGRLRVDTFGSNYDTILSAYRGSCMALVPIAGGCNDDAGGLQSAIDVAAGTGDIVHLMVTSLDRGAGTLALQVDFPGLASTPTPTRLQATATPTPSAVATPTPVACAGDCSGDRQITVDEIVAGVTIALGTIDVAACPAFDLNGDLAVSVDELVTSIRAALEGCPPQQRSRVRTGPADRWRRMISGR